MRFTAVFIERNGHKKGTIQLHNVISWASACMKAHNAIQEVKQKEDYKTNWVLHKIIRRGINDKRKTS